MAFPPEKHLYMLFQKGFGRYLLWLLCWFILLSCSRSDLGEEDIAEIGVATISYSTLELEVLERVNLYRSEKQLPRLYLLDAISEQAKTHNRHMVSKREVCHHFFGSRYLALKEGAGAVAVGENVGFGYHSAEAVVKAWTKSQAHEKNISGNYTHFGISITAGEEGKFYFTNIFIRKGTI